MSNDLAASALDAGRASGVCDYCHLSLPLGPRLLDEPEYCCLGCRLAAEITRERGQQGALHWTMARLGLAIFLSINVMMFTMALWTDELSDARAGGSGALAASLADLFRYLCLLLSLPVLLLLGGPLWENALRLRQRDAAAADLLILLGVAASYIYSVISVVRGSGHIYFEVGCAVLVMVTLGRWLEANGKLKTTEALDGLEKLLPTEVRCVDARGMESWTPIAAVRVGDHLRFVAGERIASDGYIVSGCAEIDQQIMTGESTPVIKQPGQDVLGGSLNLDGDLIVEITAPPQSGTLARMIDAVRQARQSKGAYQRLSERVAYWFLRGVIVVAVATFAVHAWHGGVDDGVLAALAVLLIACPCALGLATPMAAWSALGTAACAGVLFRSGEALERLAALQALRFDKTGTLTTGSPRVTRFEVEWDDQREEVLRRALFLTRASNHVSASAIESYIDRERPVEMSNWQARARSSVTTVAGRGVSAAFDGDAGPTYLGSVRWLDAVGCRLGPALWQVVDAANRAGDSYSVVGWRGQVHGIFVLMETLRPEARDALASCRALALDVAVLTGDNSARARVVAHDLDVPVTADLSPEQKVAARIAARALWGAAGMIGDGINDAPALAVSDLGIALGCGADVTRETAGVCILSDNLSCVPWAISLARRSVRIMRQNLFWAFAYNAVGIVLAAMGLLNPAFAAAAMVISSSLVVSNSLRLSREAPPPPGMADHHTPPIAPERPEEAIAPQLADPAEQLTALGRQ